jgi:hypothetical protein
MAVVRFLVAVALAIVAGIGITIVDASPGWDSTGITAGALAIAGFVVVLVEGSGRILRVAVLAVLVGIWIPVLEITPAGAYGPLLALVFAAAGAVAGMLVIRAIRRSPGAPPAPGA